MVELLRLTAYNRLNGWRRYMRRSIGDTTLFKNTWLWLLVLVLASSGVFASPSRLDDWQTIRYTQQLFRQQGIDLPRSAIDIRKVEGWGRVLYIRLFVRRTTLSSNVLAAYLIAGAVSQQTASGLDQIVVIAEMEFKETEQVVTAASAECCEKLYNHLMSIEQFTRECLITDLS